MAYDLLALGVFVSWCAWDGWRRALADRKEARLSEHKIASDVVARLAELDGTTAALVADLGEQKAQFKTVLQTFLQTVLDALKIAADDRQKLENAMQAVKIKNKGGL